MVLKKIEIRNFRGFIEQTVEFEDNLNVFIGSNGSGKTSLLIAILKSLYSFTQRFVQPNPRLSEFILNGSDINYESTNCEIKAFISDENISFNNPLTIYEGDSDDALKAKRKAIAHDLNIYVKQYREFIQSENFQAIPIIKFYPANRGRVEYVLANSSNHKTYFISQLEAWENIYQNDLSYSRFLDWFFENETDELRLKRDTNNLDAESPRLQYVRKAINQTLKLMYDKDYLIKSNRREVEGTNRLVPTLSLEKNKGNLESEFIDSKSDGEKVFVTLIADIAYNLSIANDLSLEKNYLKSSGIVLIDEIESHLHPNWQRKIIDILTSVFPNIQFFITTHSPQILSAVNSKNVFICDNFQIDKMNFKSLGEDSNSLLKYVFNSTERPQKFIELIHKFDSLIDNSGSVEEIRKVIDQIEIIENEDKGGNISLLVSELDLKLEAYKFELENEAY